MSYVAPYGAVPPLLKRLQSLSSAAELKLFCIVGNTGPLFCPLLITIHLKQIVTVTLLPLALVSVGLLLVTDALTVKIKVVTRYIVTFTF